MLPLGCLIAFAVGIISGKAIKNIYVAMAAGAGGILIATLLLAPGIADLTSPYGHGEVTLAMKILFPACGALGGAARVIWAKTAPDEQESAKQRNEHRKKKR